MGWGRTRRFARTLGVGAPAATLVLLGFVGSAIAAPSFAPPSDFAAGESPYSVATGDFNGDSDPDLAVANLDSDDVSVLLGDGVPGSGDFGAPTDYPTGSPPSSPISVAVGDFNGDSDPDLAVANSIRNPFNVSVWLGDGVPGGGAFVAAPGIFDPAATSSVSVAIGDFNGDSDPDLAIANLGASEVMIVLGGAGGTFGAPTKYPVAALPRSVAVGDFNGDSDPDLAVTGDSNQVSILLGDGVPGGSGFGAATNFPVGNQPQSVAVGDFNGDSDPDLATANPPGEVSVLLGDGVPGGGGFGAATSFPGGSLPVSVAVGDLNADADPDLALAANGSDSAAVLLGQPGGGFGAPTEFAAGSDPQSVAIGDFDADSNRDLAVANVRSDNVSVLLNAATVSMQAGILTYRDAGHDQLNDPTLSFDGANLVVDDASAPLAAGTGCAQVDADTVTCLRTAVFHGYDVSLGASGGDAESATVAGSLPPVSMGLLRGGPGPDTLSGGAAAEELNGGLGADTLAAGDGADRLDGGAGVDPDVLDGGDGRDRAVYKDRADPLSLSLDGIANDGAVAGEGDSLIAIEGLHGGEGSDTLEGDEEKNGLNGGQGADELLGGPGADDLNGGPRPHSDTLDGGAGRDRAVYSPRTAPLSLSLDDIANDGAAGEGDSLIAIERLLGGEAGDTIEGDGADNTLVGGPGADSLFGRSANDVLRADDGAADTLINCGAGTDRAVLDPPDPPPVGCEL